MLLNGMQPFWGYVHLIQQASVHRGTRTGVVALTYARTTGPQSPSRRDEDISSLPQITRGNWAPYRSVGSSPEGTRWDHALPSPISRGPAIESLHSRPRVP